MPFLSVFLTKLLISSAKKSKDTWDFGPHNIFYNSLFRVLRSHFFSTYLPKTNDLCTDRKNLRTSVIQCQTRTSLDVRHHLESEACGSLHLRLLIHCLVLWSWLTPNHIFFPNNCKSPPKVTIWKIAIKAMNTFLQSSLFILMFCTVLWKTTVGNNLWI